MKTKKLVLTALTVTLLGSGAVFAQGNSGNSNGNGANDSGNNGRGAIASELKWRNAAHASEQAFLNASPNSAVGKLATYRAATEALAAAWEEAELGPDAIVRPPEDVQAEIDLYIEIPRTSAEIQIAIDEAAVAGTDTTLLEAEKLAAEAYEALLVELELSESLAGVIAAEAEATAVVGADLLSEEAYDALWELLER